MQETKALLSRSRGNLGVVLERRPQCAVSHEVRRRGQRASRGAPGKSGLHASGEGERVIAPEPRALSKKRFGVSCEGVLTIAATRRGNRSPVFHRARGRSEMQDNGIILDYKSHRLVRSFSTHH